MAKKINSPFVYCEHETVSAQTDFEQEYITLEHKDVVKKTGEGEEDYVIVTKHIVKKEPISEVVARDAGTCSIQHLMEQVLRTGDRSLLPDPMPKDGVINDVTGVPDNFLELDNMQKEMAKKFDALPDELKKGRSFAEFCELITQDEFMAFIASIAPKNEKKEGDE